MKKLLALLAVLGIGTMASAAVLPANVTWVKSATVTSLGGNPVDAYTLTIASGAGNVYSGIDVQVEGSAVFMNMSWVPVYEENATGVYQGVSYKQMIDVYPAGRPNAVDSNYSSSSPYRYSTGIVTGSLVGATAKFGTQESTFGDTSGFVEPTYTLFYDDLAGEVMYEQDTPGSSGLQIGTFYRCASAVDTDSLSSINVLVILGKDTSATVGLQTTNGAGVKSDWISTVVPEPMTLSLLAIGAVGLLRRKLA